MDNPEKLATQDTQDTGAIKNGQSRETDNTGHRSYQEWPIQRNWQHKTHKTQELSRMDNPEKLATQDTGAIKNGQSRETGNTRHTRHRRMTNTATTKNTTQHRKLKTTCNTDLTKNNVQHRPH